MTTNANTINYKRILVNILFLLLFASILIKINPDFPSYYSTAHRIIAYTILSGATLFFIHSLVLLPILTTKKDLKTYKKSILRCVAVYII